MKKEYVDGRIRITRPPKWFCKMLESIGLDWINWSYYKNNQCRYVEYYCKDPVMDMVIDRIIHYTNVK